MYVDTHSHLNLEQFADDWQEVALRMQEKNVRTQTVGTDAVSSQRALHISHALPSVSRALVGIHPAYVEADQDYEHDLVLLRQMVDDELCVGIGECGFDYFRVQKSDHYDAQRFVFETQVGWSRITKKPVMLHLRPTKHTFDAYDDALEILESYRGEVTGQAHFFAGTLDQARRFLDLGYYISCTGVVTFTHDYDELIRYVPSDRLLLETDAPYVAPVPYRGGRCEPWQVIEVYKKVVELKATDMDSLMSRIELNVRELYTW
jgi:TatD DNase family protein